jgi:ergothioneine biosynthesis protein EgtB
MSTTAPLAEISPDAAGHSDPRAWQRAYAAVRGLTEAIVAPLELEDYGLQSMPDVSPAKWHLAHTTWFFETFVLRAYDGEGAAPDPRYASLFNSYYNAVGPMHPRAQRGLLSRPTVAEVRSYRARVDERIAAGLERWPAAARAVVELGLHHEQQHQELLLTDLKHALGCNPLRPRVRPEPPRRARGTAVPLHWVEHGGGLVAIGHAGRGFAFDNEGPRHRVWLEPYALGSRLVTCGEYLAFIADGGYERSELWLDAGWACARREGWSAPLHWERRAEQWWMYTLHGMRQVDEAEPVVHVSQYEADAYARWAGARLPREAEWEVLAAQDRREDPRALDLAVLHPQVQDGERGEGWLGDAWVWTASAYEGYPGFRVAPGALGEYNGKFMSGQHVLRGGSCATPAGHVRPTYRNFFPPAARWQFSGIRLAKDLT